MTCLRSHNKDMVVLTLKPMCVPQAAQGNLQPHPTPPQPPTAKEGAAGEQRDRQVGRDPRPSFHRHMAMEAKSLPFSGRHMAPAEPGLAFAAKQFSFLSGPSGPPGPLSPLPGTLATTSLQGPGLSGL